MHSFCNIFCDTYLEITILDAVNLVPIKRQCWGKDIIFLATFEKTSGKRSEMKY